MKRFFSLGLIGLFALAGWNSFGQGQVLELNNPAGTAQAVPVMETLTESNQHYRVEDFYREKATPAFQAVSGGTIPIKPGVVWVRLQLRIPEGNQRWWIEFGNWLIDSATMYNQAPDGRIEKIENGLFIPVEKRQANARNISFELFQRPAVKGQAPVQTYYFRIESSLSSIQMPVTIGSVGAINQKQFIESLIIALIICAFLVFAIIGLALLVGSRERVWIYYSLLAIFAGIIFAASSGILVDLFGGRFGYLLMEIYPAVESAYLVLSLLLMMRFLGIDSSHKTLFYLPLAMVVAGTVLAVAQFLLPGYLLLTVKLSALLFYLLAVSIVRIVIPVLMMRQGKTLAGLYLAAFSIEIFGSGVYLFYGLGFLPNSEWTNRAPTLGGILMFIIICYGVSVRIRKMAGQIQANNKKLAFINDELEEKVSLRTRELETERNKLMLLAMEDDLTGLMSRRRILELLDQEFQRFKRYGGVFALMMIDLDHFKMINDTHGHLVGDQVLRDLAEVLRSVLRDTDLCGRLGGEEILVLLPQTSAAKAMHAAEKVRQAMANLEFKQADGGIFHVTCSIGVVEVGRQFDHIQGLLRESDAAMYKAKAAGRNRVAMAG